MGGDDRAGFWRHLAYLAGKAVEATLAVCTGDSPQDAHYSSGAGEERGEREACEAEVGTGQANFCEEHTLVEFFVPRCVFTGPFFGAHGVDEDQARDFSRMVDGEAADDDASEGVTDEDVRRRNAGAFEKEPEFADDVRWGSFGGAGAAPAEAGSVVGDGAGEGADCALQMGPVEAGGGDA